MSSLMVERQVQRGMLLSLSRAMIRHHRGILATTVVVSVSYLLLRWFVAPNEEPLIDLLVYGPLIGFVILSLLLLRSSPETQPAALAVRPEASSFSTPPRPELVWAALWSALWASGQIGSDIPTIRAHDLGLWDITNITVTVLLTMVASLNVVVAWRGLAVQLRPEGLRWRRLTGSVCVPWEALPPDHPQRPALPASRLILTYARPELVRRRGLVRHPQRLPVSNVHPWFIADAIRHYVTHPEHRTAIGTEAEYHRLQKALHDALVG